MPLISQLFKRPFVLITLFTFIFFTPLFTQSESQKALAAEENIGSFQQVYHFPAPFDEADFPFTNVILDENTPEWAQLLYEENPNIGAVKTLYDQWRKSHPTVKNGHTRNFKKLYGYLIEHQAIDSAGFIDLPTETETKAQAKKIHKNRNQFALNSQAAGRSNNNTTWQSMGPFSMKYTNGALANAQINIYAIGQSLSNPNVLYCTSETGGTVFKTIDNGDNWFSVSDDLITNMGPRALEVAPTDPDIVYLGTKHDIYKTSDGGNVWTSVYNNNSVDVKTIIIHPTQADIVLAGGDTGILKTTDGGANWTTTLAGVVIYDLRFKPGDPQTVYALVDNATTNQTDFYKSTDGGNTWVVKTSGWPSEASSSNRGGRMTVSDGNSHIVYVFIGANWTNANNEHNIKILKSSDSGESWTLKVDYDNAKGINSGQGYYDWDIEMSDVDPNIIAFGTQASWISYDDLTTVTSDMRSGWSGHADIQEMLFNGTEIWVTNDGGITKYENDSLYNYEVKSYGINATSFWSFDQGWNRDAQVGTHYHNGTSARTDSYESGIHIQFGGAEPSFSLLAQPNADTLETILSALG